MVVVVVVVITLLVVYVVVVVVVVIIIVLLVVVLMVMVVGHGVGGCHSSGGCCGACGRSCRGGYFSNGGLWWLSGRAPGCKSPVQIPGNPYSTKKIFH